MGRSQKERKKQQKDGREEERKEGKETEREILISRREERTKVRCDQVSI